MGYGFDYGVSRAAAELGLEKTALNRLETLLRAGALSKGTLQHLPSEARGLTRLYQRRKSPFVLTPKAQEKQDTLLQGLREKMYADPRAPNARADEILTRQAGPMSRALDVPKGVPGEVEGLLATDAGQAVPRLVSHARGAKSPISRAYRQHGRTNPVTPLAAVSKNRKPEAVYVSSKTPTDVGVIGHEAAEREAMFNAVRGRTGVVPFSTHADVLPNVVQQSLVARSPGELANLRSEWRSSKSPLEREFTRLMKQVQPTPTGGFNAGSLNDPHGSRAVRALRKTLIRRMQTNPGYYSPDLRAAFETGAFGHGLDPALEKYFLPRMATYAKTV